jgi:hypothetical protein
MSPQDRITLLRKTAVIMREEGAPICRSMAVDNAADEMEQMVKALEMARLLCEPGKWWSWSYDDCSCFSGVGRMRNGTICSKHELIEDAAETIKRLVQQCLEDGQNMEKGLDRKRDRIEELESELNVVSKERDSLLEELEDAKSKIKDLEAEIEAVV